MTGRWLPGSPQTTTTKESTVNVREVQEARRSNACAPRRNLKKYRRKIKHPKKGEQQ